MQAVSWARGRHRAGRVARLGGVLLALVTCPLFGCAGVAIIPDPAPVVAAYSQALLRGDADAVYESMSAESKRALSREELERVLREQKNELEEHARGLTSAERAIEAHAEVRFDDGEVVGLELRDGSFWLSAADALPAAAHGPAQALVELRRMLARRSYTGLLRLLSPRRRSDLESDLRGLVDGLSEPDALDIKLSGDLATVSLPGGHLVVLRREDGVWYVDDFD